MSDKIIMSHYRSGKLVRSSCEVTFHAGLMDEESFFGAEYYLGIDCGFVTSLS